MKVSRGKLHEHLGMTLDYSVKSQFKITIMDYINKILECLDNTERKASSTKSSTSPMNLFVVDEDCEKLSKEKAETLHKIVANMLFATKRARPDTSIDKSYLTTRVRDPDQSDWLKMVHLFKYVRGNKYLPLILSADKSGFLKWYIYVSHELHPNMMGHIGGGLTLGRGFPISASSNHNFNTRISTKSEIVGVDQIMP